MWAADQCVGLYNSTVEGTLYDAPASTTATADEIDAPASTGAEGKTNRASVTLAGAANSTLLRGKRLQIEERVDKALAVCAFFFNFSVVFYCP